MLAELEKLQNEKELLVVHANSMGTQMQAELVAANALISELRNQNAWLRAKVAKVECNDEFINGSQKVPEEWNDCEWSKLEQSWLKRVRPESPNRPREAGTPLQGTGRKMEDVGSLGKTDVADVHCTAESVGHRSMNDSSTVDQVTQLLHQKGTRQTIPRIANVHNPFQEASSNRIQQMTPVHLAILHRLK